MPRMPKVSRGAVTAATAIRATGIDSAKEYMFALNYINISDREGI